MQLKKQVIESLQNICAIVEMLKCTNCTFYGVNSFPHELDPSTGGPTSKIKTLTLFVKHSLAMLSAILKDIPPFPLYRWRGGGDNSGHTEAPVPYYKWHNGGELTSPCYCVGLGMSQDRRHSSLVLLRVGFLGYGSCSHQQRKIIIQNYCEFRIYFCRLLVHRLEAFQLA